MQKTSWSAKIAILLCAACCASGSSAFADDYRTERRAGSVSTARRTIPEELPSAYDSSPGTFISKPSLIDGLAPPPVVVGPEVWENPVDSRIPLDMPAQPWSSGSWFMSGRRYVQADMLFAQVVRAKNDRTTLAQDSANTTRVLTTNGRTYGIEPGMRLTLGTFTDRDYLNRDHSVEFTFLGIGEFEMNDGIAGLGNNSIVSPLNVNIPGFSGADTQTTTLDARFYSFEVNYKVKKRLEKDRMVMGPDGSWTRQFTKGYVPSMMYGLRFISYEEDFNWQSRQSGVDPATFSGDYSVNTTNDLLGVQVGGEILDQYETWYWGFRGKAGAYVNFSDLDRRIDINTSVIRDEHGSLNAAAFAGEFSTLAAYQLSPNWTLRASYDLTMMAGIAGHSQQVNFNFDPVVGVNNNAFVLIQSLSLGMEMTW